MVILELYQGDYQKDLVAFDSLEEGRAFVAQIPGYTVETEDGFGVEFVNPKYLPDYNVVLFDGKPLSDDDVNKIAQIIELSLGVTVSDNK